MISVLSHFLNRAQNKVRVSFSGLTRFVNMTNWTTKHKLFHKYINNKSDFNHRQFKLYRNKLKHLIDISKKQHYCKYFAENMNTMKNTWRGIEQLITTKSKKSQTPNNITLDNKSLTNSKDIANAFNDYFATIGSTLANSIPNGDKCFLNI